MSSRYSSCFSLMSPNIRSRSTCENPRIALSGVRSSCDMFARNSDLCWLVASSSAYRRLSSSFIRFTLAARVPSSSRFTTSTWPVKSPDEIAASRASIPWIGPTSDQERAIPSTSARTSADAATPMNRSREPLVGSLVLRDQLVGLRASRHGRARRRPGRGRWRAARPRLTQHHGDLAGCVAVFEVDDLCHQCRQLIRRAPDRGQVLRVLRRGREPEPIDGNLRGRSGRRRSRRPGPPRGPLPGPGSRIAAGPDLVEFLGRRSPRGALERARHPAGAGRRRRLVAGGPRGPRPGRSIVRGRAGPSRPTATSRTDVPTTTMSSLVWTLTGSRPTALASGSEPRVSGRRGSPRRPFAALPPVCVRPTRPQRGQRGRSAHQVGDQPLPSIRATSMIGDRHRFDLLGLDPDVVTFEVQRAAGRR